MVRLVSFHSVRYTTFRCHFIHMYAFPYVLSFTWFYASQLWIDWTSYASQTAFLSVRAKPAVQQVRALAVIACKVLVVRLVSVVRLVRENGVDRRKRCPCPLRGQSPWDHVHGQRRHHHVANEKFNGVRIEARGWERRVVFVVLFVNPVYVFCVKQAVRGGENISESKIHEKNGNRHALVTGIGGTPQPCTRTEAQSLYGPSVGNVLLQRSFDVPLQVKFTRSHVRHKRYQRQLHRVRRVHAYPHGFYPFIFYTLVPGAHPPVDTRKCIRLHTPS